MLICTNEQIVDLKVEGRNKDEVYKKLSVIDLGETPMSRSSSEHSTERRREIVNLAYDLRKCLPSFLGFMLQVCDVYISGEEFQAYEEITKHERLGNILKNVANLHLKLNLYCEAASIMKPKSLEKCLDTSCLTNKSVLVNKYKNPDQVIDYLVKTKEKLVLTEHEDQDGVAFDSKCLKKMPWFKETFKAESNGVKVFQKMRTRQLTPGKESRASFLKFDWLKSESVEKIKSYVTLLEDVVESCDDVTPEDIDNIEPPLYVDVETSIAGNDDMDGFEPEPDVETPITGKDEILDVLRVGDLINDECVQNDFVKTERQMVVDSFILSLFNVVDESAKRGVHCSNCKFVSKSQGGLKNHMRKCAIKR